MAAVSDRSESLDKAAKALARGEVDTALRLYLHVFDQDPRDWNVGNSLGDLYLKMGKADDAVAHFTMLAEQLAADGFATKARALYRKIVRFQPDNAEARKRVEELDRQQVGQTSPFLQRVLDTARTLREAPPSPPVVQPLAAAVAPAPAVATPPVVEIPPVVATPPVIAGPSAAVSAADDAAREFGEMEQAVRAASARRDFRDAAWIIERFLSGHPGHCLALEHLIDVCVEGGLDAPLVSAQERLVDACVAARHFRQAFDAALDLTIRAPHVASHRSRLERVVAVAKDHGRTFVVPELVVEEEAEEVAIAIEPPRPAPQAPTPAPAGAIAIGPPFGDLLKAWSDPERPFEEIRDGLLEAAAAAADERFAEGARLAEARQYAEAVRALDESMCLPRLCAPAGSRLARIYRDTGEPDEAFSVLELAAEVPPEDEESGHELAYELALTLEALGQHTQALGVYRELVAEVGPAYRDVATRVERLAAA